MSERAVLLEPSATPAVARFLDGCARLGIEVIDPPTRTPGLELMRFLKSCRFAITGGIRPSTAILRGLCRRQRLPLAVIDLGYMRRAAGPEDVTGYFQLGWNGLNQIPAGPLPPDRLEALGLKVTKRRAPPPDGYMLIAGQVADDPQHGLSRSELHAWLARKYRNTGWQGPVFFRPHPLQPRHPFMLPVLEGSLGDALEGARSLLTYNSTTGVDAMLRDIPVHCSETAHYHPYANNTTTRRLAYLSRLAYAQWSLSEFADGSALEFLLQQKP